MDEKPDQIMNHIESERNQLGRNLNELESRVKRTADWRAQFDRNPMLMMGLALGGGLLLGTMTGSSRRTSRSSWSSASKSYGTTGSSSGYGSSASYASAPSYSSSASSSHAPSYTSPAIREQKRKATDTLEQIRAALIGFATAKVREFMTEALPGFNQHMDEAERRHQELHGHGGQGSSASQQHSGQQSYGGRHDQEYRPSTGMPGSPGTGYGSGAGQTGQQGSQSNSANVRTEQSASHSPYKQEPHKPEPVKTGMNI